VSNYLEIVTKLDDPAILAQTLREVGERLGFTCEVGTGQLHGFASATRPADFIIRKSQVKGMFADMGWARAADGTYTVVYDDYGRAGGRVRQIMSEVAYHYSVVEAERLAAREGYTIQREYNQAGQVIALGLTME
jgi:hypothetical protein